MNRETDVLKNIYLLSGAGGHAPWQMGMLKGLVEMYPPDEIYGISAGALIGLAIASDFGIDSAYQISKKMRPWNLGRLLRQELEKFPKPKIPIGIQATRVADWRRISVFSSSLEDIEMLRKVVYASSRHPSIMKDWGGLNLVDGGIYDTVPVALFRRHTKHPLHSCRVIVVNAREAIKSKNISGFLAGIRTQIAMILKPPAIKSYDDMAELFDMVPQEVLEFRPQKKLGSKIWGGPIRAKRYFNQGEKEFKTWHHQVESQ